ncbi:hypothetical protein B0H16DRAFT_1903820 [Mycena metata]|uniref:F-box domain-containing protein n=1 Tax=Mycena metata TaxID=1033252 RepID=A0AAD7DR41_9AGAR|nr:hypothetical protein B0H16DRAFT_1903820 [Mycena metata]
MQPEEIVTPPPEILAHYESGPFFKIPVEIKSMIFGHCIESPEPDSKSAPLLLGQVCRHWREVTLSSPELWSSFIKTIVVDHTLNVAPSRYNSLLELLKIWLARSATRPLNFALLYKGIRIRPLPPPIHQLLLQHAHRWEHVILCLPYSDLVELFGKCTGSLPLLRTLAISLPHYERAQDIDPAEEPLSFEVLRHSSLLQTIEMSLNRAWPSLSSVPWTQLTSFNGHHLRVRNAYDVLRSCPALQECRLKITIKPDDPFTSLHLPELRVLHIAADWSSGAFAFLAQLTLPRLQRLQCPCLDSDSVRHVVAFLSQSLCPLTHFSTISEGPPGRSLQGEEIFINLFTALPHLVEMGLDVGWQGSPNPVASLLRSENHYLPRLTRLELRAREAIDHELLVGMLEYRTGANKQGAAVLGRFAWSYQEIDSGYPTARLSPALAERIKALLRRGIEMDFDDSAFDIVFC